MPLFAILLLTCLMLSSPLQAQQARIVKTDKGQTEFFSKAAGPAQDIQAIDKTGKVSLNLADGSIDVKILMKNFVLPKSLMQKHYNERYMETDQFPGAAFSGKIRNWNPPASDTTLKVTAFGDFTVHGVTRRRQIRGTLKKEGGRYRIDAEFEVKLADHKITVPVLFFTRITEAVKVTARYDLSVEN